MSRSLVGFVVLAACSSPAVVAIHSPPPAQAPSYVLLEPAPELGPIGELAVVRPLAAEHPRRAELERVLERPYLRWVLALGDVAKQRARRRCGADAACARRFDQPAYFVVMKGGNRPRQGLAIASSEQPRELPDAFYVEIDPDTAATLIPHEYGHVLMFQSLPGDLPRKPQTLPHTTGAITNDVVALSEGWGIHFETLAGDRRREGATHAVWHRDTFAVAGDLAAGDSLVAVADLFNYAQTYQRYGCIKANCFAYLPRPLESYVRDVAPTANDILARWTDTTFDPGRVRSLDQLVASEGVIATLFYRLATAPEPGGPSGAAGDPPLPDPARYAALFDAFAQVTEQRARETPAVLVFLEALLDQAAPAERTRIARIAMEVFHYTLGVREAPRLYAELHAAGHRVDKPAYRQRLATASAELESATRRLVEQPASLRELADPELWLANDALLLELPVLGIAKRPLVFDLNTAPVELLMTIPNVTYTEAVAIDDARRSRGLRSVDDLAVVAGVRRATVDAIRAMRAAFERSGKRR
jgi:hypothetical protein